MTDVYGLIDLIRTELHIDIELDEQTPLLSSGIVDSFGVAALLGAIEDEYGVLLDETELSVETFDTPEQILRLIEAGEPA